MKKLAGVTLVVAFLVPASAGAQERVENGVGGYQAQTHTISMNANEAKFYVRKGLRQKPRLGWEAGQGKRIWDCDRVTNDSRRCSVRWGIGDISYRGRVFVRYEDCGQFICWDGGYRLRRTNHYCEHVTPQRDCTERKRGEFRGGYVYTSDPGA